MLCSCKTRGWRSPQVDRECTTTTPRAGRLRPGAIRVAAHHVRYTNGELPSAYAIARSTPATAPTPTSAGLPDAVRTLVGGLPPLAATSDFVSTRDALMREQRISTSMESSGDRAIAIRMYGLAAVVDTTWGSADLHTTVFPRPTIELTGRTGHLTPVCQ
jgi:hypothetical protein